MHGLERFWRWRQVLIRKTKILWREVHEMFWEMESYATRRLTGDAPLTRISEEENKITRVKDYRWPFYKNALFGRALMKYMASCKDEESEDYNLSNLMFIVGPEKVGKSWFTKYYLKSFENKHELKKSPLIIHWDLDQRPSLNFDTFIASFDDLLINAIASHCGNPLNDATLTNQEILDVFMYRFRPEFVKFHLRRTLNRFLEDEDQFIVDDDCKAVMIEVIEELGLKFNLDNEFMKNKLMKIIDALNASNQDEHNIHNTLRFIRSFLISVELDSRPEEYASTYYRTGIETTDFYFDVLNYLAGYHEIKHYVDFLARNESVDEFIHPTLVIEGFDKILKLGSCENRAQDWIDHLILRLYTDFRQRTHFPVVIESNNSRFFHHQIFDLLHIEQDVTFPTAEIMGWRDEDFLVELEHIYSNKQMRTIENVLGRNMHDWHAVTRAVIETPNSDLKKVLSFKSEFMIQQKNIFLAKVQSLYANPLLLKELDQGTIDFRLLAAFEMLTYSHHEGQIFVGNALGFTLLEDPMVKALLDVNILYLRRYHSLLEVHRELYLYFMKDFLQAKKKKMSLWTRIRYMVWKRRNGYTHKGLSPYLIPNYSGSPADSKTLLEHEIPVYPFVARPGEKYENDFRELIRRYFKYKDK